MKSFIKICWALTALSSAVGGIVGALGIITASSAPQEASIAAIAIALAVIPYCFTRALQQGSKGDI